MPRKKSQGCFSPLAMGGHRGEARLLGNIEAQRDIGIPCLSLNSADGKPRPRVSLSMPPLGLHRWVSWEEEGAVGSCRVPALTVDLLEVRAGSFSV